MTVLEHLDLRPAPRDKVQRPLVPPRRVPARTWAYVERALVVMGLALVASVHSSNLGGWPRYFDDEGTYYSQAWAVLHQGALAPYTYWYDHPPVGWLQIAAFVWLPDLLIDGAGSELLAGRVVMVGYTTVTAFLVFLLAKRLGLRSPFALAAMLLWALSPLVLFEGRQIFLDNVALPWLLGAFVLVLNRQRDLWRYMAAGLCFGVAVLSKETVLVVLPALLVALWQSAFRPTRAFAVTGLTVMVVVTGAMYLLFAAVRNELLPGPDHVSLWDALMFQFRDREGSGFILDSSTGAGGAYQTLQSWLDQDRYLLLGGLAAGAVCLFLRHLRAVGLAIVLLAAVALRPQGYLPAMYVIAVLPFCALALAGFGDAAWTAARTVGAGWLRGGMTLAVVLALAAQGSAVHDWRFGLDEAFGQEVNDTHAAALEHIQAELPRTSTVVVDNTYWNDLVVRGWSDRPDGAVWFYKVDSDPLVQEQLGGDFTSLDYLVWTYTMRDNAGPVVREAYENSRTVWARGTGDDAVEIRRVLSRREVAQQKARQEKRAEARRRAEARQLAAAEKARTEARSSFPGLTVGQVEAIREEHRSGAGRRAIARKYGVSEQLVRRIAGTRGNGA